MINVNEEVVFRGLIGFFFADDWIEENGEKMLWNEMARKIQFLNEKCEKSFHHRIMEKAEKCRKASCSIAFRRQKAI